MTERRQQVRLVPIGDIPRVDSKWAPTAISRRGVLLAATHMRETIDYGAIKAFEHRRGNGARKA